jgi:benzoyl-CoA reductase subunit B
MRGASSSLAELRALFEGNLQFMEPNMTTIVTPKAAPAKEVEKDASMVKQKEMMAGHYERLTSAQETGTKVCSTFVPGNLNELIMCFDLLNNLPEINAIQSGLRRQSGAYVLEAEKIGHSEDVCTYVKSDIGMMAKGNIGPNGKKMPDPNVLLLSYTGCFTFMKWFELLREQYKCETIMLHTPYLGDGKITRNMVDYMVKQLKEEVIPTLERVSGVKFDIDRLRENLKKSVKAEDNLVHVLQQAKKKPSPIDAYFGGIYYIGPIFGAFRGTDDAINYYNFLRSEIDERVATGKGPMTPDGEMTRERYRLVTEGPPNYTNFRQFWKMFYDEDAVVVASSYTKVGGVYDFGFRHDPNNPLETLAEYCLGVYSNRSMSMRIDMLVNYINEYEADGLLINSIKSCNSFSAGQLLLMREVEKRTGKPAAFVESDLVDPRYFSAANIKNRLESYFQMIEQKRAASAPS